MAGETRAHEQRTRSASCCREAPESGLAEGNVMTDHATIGDLLTELDLDAAWLEGALAKEERRRVHVAPDKAARNTEAHTLPLLVPLLLNCVDRFVSGCFGDAGDAWSHRIQLADPLSARNASILRLCRYFRRLPECTAEEWAARRRRIRSPFYSEYHSCLTELALHHDLANRGFLVRFTDRSGHGGPDLTVRIAGLEIPVEVKSRVGDLTQERSSLDVGGDTIRAVTRLFGKPIRSGQLLHDKPGAVFVEATAVDGLLLQQQLAELASPGFQGPLNQTIRALRAATERSRGPAIAQVLMFLDPTEYRVARLVRV